MVVTNKDRIAIRSVVELQLEAFQRDDAIAAFAYASPQIQAMFNCPKTFMEMVKRGYCPVYRPRAVIFEDISIIQGNVTQMLLLLGPDGVPVRALYIMEQQSDNFWKISGCFLVPTEAEII
jgi:Domain of unknown function (DUF4864)